MPTRGGLETLLPSAAISDCRSSGQSDSAAHPHLNLTHSRPIARTSANRERRLPAGRKVVGNPTPSAARAQHELQADGAQRFEGRFRHCGRPEDRAVELALA